MLTLLRQRLTNLFPPRRVAQAAAAPKPSSEDNAAGAGDTPPVSRSHALIDELVQEGSGLSLLRIASEEPCDAISQPGGGYNAFGNEWWSNLDCPYAFKYLSLDSLYRPNYFGDGVGHPERHTATELYLYMQETYRSLFGQNFASVIELGTGGGEITVAFAAESLDFLALEGTAAGVEALRAKGIDPARIVKCNLKFLPDQGRRFDIAMCTEVMEHVEPFFASKIADNCIRHSDVVWFSSADRNRPAHYHHSNEQPIEVWDNLFAHMGYPWFVPLNGLNERASRLYISDRVGAQLKNGRAAAPYFVAVAEREA